MPNSCRSSGTRQNLLCSSYTRSAADAPGLKHLCQTTFSIEKQRLFQGSSYTRDALAIISGTLTLDARKVLQLKQSNSSYDSQSLSRIVLKNCHLQNLDSVAENCVDFPYLSNNFGEIFGTDFFDWQLFQLRAISTTLTLCFKNVHQFP